MNIIDNLTHWLKGTTENKEEELLIYSLELNDIYCAVVGEPKIYWWDCRKQSIPVTWLH